MTDLIIGCYTKYNWDQIKYWSNSIDKCGFKGDKAMIVFDSDMETAQKLIDKNFTLFAFSRDDATKSLTYPGPYSIVVQRFYHLWQYLSNLPKDKKYKNVITTDVKDVVFQSDPSAWISKNLGTKKILVSSESLQYKSEPWGNDNMANSFPMLHQYMSDKTIWNCGVLAGDADIMKDLFLNIFLMSVNNRIHNPDQAALNVLLSMEPYKKITKFVTSEEGWACQAGTTVDPLKIDDFRPHLLEPEPTWNGKVACTSKGKPFVVLHQYDRVPEWKKIVESSYE